MKDNALIKICPADQTADKKLKNAPLNVGLDAIEGIFDVKNTSSGVRIPRFPQFTKLIVSRLQIPADHFADKPNQNIFVKPKWEGPEFYEPASGLRSRDWFVWIKFQHPITGKMERFKYNVGFSQYSTKALKREHGKALMIIIDDLLKEGWSPFSSYKEIPVNHGSTVVSLIDKYLHDIAGNIKATTLRKYNTELQLFKKFLIANGHSQTLIGNIKKSIVTTFLTYYSVENKWSGKTYNNYLNDITAFFNYFYNNYDDLIEKVPTVSMKRSTIERKGNLAYNDWQFKKLKELMLNNHDEILYTFCSFVYYGALRNEAECNYLKAEQFNFKQMTLRIDSGSAKNKKTEYIPIYPEFLELLLKLGIDQLPPHYYIFSRKKERGELCIGGTIKLGLEYFRKKFRERYKKPVGLSNRHGIYCYKHTRAVHLGEDGEDLFKIMKLFRHKDLATTMIYMRDLGINFEKSEYKKGREF